MVKRLSRHQSGLSDFHVNSASIPFLTNWGRLIYNSPTIVSVDAKVRRQRIQLSFVIVTFRSPLLFFKAANWLMMTTSTDRSTARSKPKAHLIKIAWKKKRVEREAKFGRECQLVKTQDWKSQKNSDRLLSRATLDYLQSVPDTCKSLELANLRADLVLTSISRQLRCIERRKQMKLKLWARWWSKPVEVLRKATSWYSLARKAGQTCGQHDGRCQWAVWQWHRRRDIQSFWHSWDSHYDYRVHSHYIAHCYAGSRCSVRNEINGEEPIEVDLITSSEHSQAEDSANPSSRQ